jgi:ferredoxin, 2Fe-2S
MGFKVTFLPIGKIVETQPGDSVLDAALRGYLDLDHACGGVCACSTCHVHVLEGLEDLPPASEREEDMLDNAPCLTSKSRLGCQIEVTRDLTVEIPPMNRNLISENKH